MKTLIYGVSGESKRYVEEYEHLDQLDLEVKSYGFSSDKIDETKGYEAIVVRGIDEVDAKSVELLANNGVKLIVTRSVGFDKIDIKKASELGIQVANVANYSPNAISEFTIGLVLASIRNFKYYITNANDFVFTTPPKSSKEIRKSTVGIVGGGHIGGLVAKGLHDLGAEVLIYSVDVNPELAKIATFTDLDTLYAKSDIISLHLPLMESTYHMLDKEAFSKMKDDVVIVNTGRGPLIDTVALLDAIDSGKVESAALDVYEHEDGIFRGEVDAGKKDPVFKRLVENPNVIVTPHDAYYTQEAIKNMVVFAFDNVVSFKESGKAKNLVN